MAEFEQHFDKRKVEVGQAGDPMGPATRTNTRAHPLPDASGRPEDARLGELESDFVARRASAEDEGWLGEIEGIDLTLAYRRHERDQAARPHPQATDQPGTREPAPMST